jgi:propanol-preferring alcohol dehydrogenase
MKAMILPRVVNLADNKTPLEPADLPIPAPGEGEILVRVSVCGVCHTELDEIEGRTPPSRFPLIPGHQIVGRVERTGPDAARFRPGDRVGIGWIYRACGRCHLCQAGDENLCPDFQATGRDAPGGYAQYATVSQDFAYPIPEAFADEEAAPLLCAGAIGYRSLRLTGIRDGENLGLFGFGASAHLVLKIVRHRFPHCQIFAFSRTPAERDFARELGAAWAGGFDEDPPEKMHRASDTTPVWQPIVAALERLEPGGRLVINAIRKEEMGKEALLRLDYSRHLWLEKEIKSVANVSRRDVAEFLDLAAQIPIKPKYQVFRLEEANQALMELKERKIRGAKVLRIE